MNRFRISTPEGTRDLLFSSCRALRQTENAVRDALEERGYSEIITPAVEYFDVFAQANPELDQDQMLKLVRNILQLFQTIGISFQRFSSCTRSRR